MFHRPYTGRVDGLNSNLNLNEGSVPRVMPNVGDWAPERVPSTRKKKHWRWFAVLAFVGALAAVTAYGYWMYTILR